jgi:hypothetical protein
LWVRYVPYKDKRKQQQAQRRSYLRNRLRNQKRTNANRAAKRETLANIAREAKAASCVDCAIRYPYYVMDFDHVRGAKLAAIGHLVNSTVPLQVLLDEIAKCEVVCANCHRERTHQRT